MKLIETRAKSAALPALKESSSAITIRSSAITATLPARICPKSNSSRKLAKKSKSSIRPTTRAKPASIPGNASSSPCSSSSQSVSSRSSSAASFYGGSDKFDFRRKHLRCDESPQHRKSADLQRQRFQTLSRHQSRQTLQSASSNLERAFRFHRRQNRNHRQNVLRTRRRRVRRINNLYQTTARSIWVEISKFPPKNI